MPDFAGYFSAIFGSAWGIAGALSTIVWVVEMTTQRKIPKLPPRVFLIAGAVLFVIGSYKAYEREHLQVLAYTRAHPPLYLWEIDPQEWFDLNGQRGEQGKWVQLDEAARLWVKPSERQRFNPQIRSLAESLSNIAVFIRFPPQMQVEPMKCWRVAARTYLGVTYEADFGSVNKTPNAYSPCDEAFFFTMSAPGRADIDYRIEGKGDVSGGFDPVLRTVHVVTR